MKVKSLGHDPNLGQKFSSEQDGLVIGLGKSSKQSSLQDSLAQFQDAQETHDEQMPEVKSADQSVETEEDAARAGALRIARWKHQNKQMRKKG